MTYVTCPTFRYHPAVVAQQAATLQLLSDGRFTLGLGAGENLNEHVVGRRLAAGRRPAGDARRGDPDHPRPLRRRRLHQLPRRALRRRVGQALGPPREAGADRRRRLRAAVLRDRRRARRRDDRRRARSPSSARCSTPPAARASRGSARCRSASAPTRPPPSPARTRCSAGSASAGRSTPSCPARRPSTRPASSSARRTSTTRIPCGDDVDAVLEAAKEYADAGFTHLALVQIGGDQQAPFIEWSEQTLMPAWRDAFGD